MDDDAQGVVGHSGMPDEEQCGRSRTGGESRIEEEGGKSNRKRKGEGRKVKWENERAKVGKGRVGMRIPISKRKKEQWIKKVRDG